MTRKILLSIILILLVFACYLVVAGDYEFVRSKIPSFSELQTSSKALGTSAANLEKISGTQFSAKEQELATVIEQYKTTKAEYESLVPQTLGGQQNEVELKDIYDIGFLWTIVGNYATEEGINLKFDVKKNNSASSSVNNTSANYVICDLEFVITGNYINLTDFIYDLEDDDRLNFEINDFYMTPASARKDVVDKAIDLTTDPDWYDDEDEASTKNANELQVTLIVREVKVNANNLLDTGSTVGEVVNNVADAVSR